jgi:hypothetical protein
MEDPGFKRRSESPPTHAFSNVSWSSDQNSASSTSSEPFLGNRNGSNGRNGSHSLKMEDNDGSRTPESGSNTDSDAQTVKREASPDAPAGPSRTTSSNKNVKQSSPLKKPSKAPIQLIAHYPRAEEAALATFETLETNWHQYKYLGKSKVQEDAMACECYYKPGL